MTEHVATTGRCLLLGTLIASAAVAADEPAIHSHRLRLDPAATAVTFTLGATLHTVEGTGKLTEGEIRFDTATGKASGRIVVDATSLNTKNEKRDANMHADVLESAKYKEIVFEASRIEGTFVKSGESDVRLAGAMTIHGAAHDITLPAHVTTTGSHVVGTATFAIPYVAWGMKDPSAFVLRVKKEVEVTLRIDGTLE